MRELASKTLILASHNAGKLREIRELMAPYGFEITSVAEMDLPEPAEEGSTFEENAFTKAHAAATASGLVALSDDSGLCIDALDGAPGVYSADWAIQPDGSRDFDRAMLRVETALNENGATSPEQRTGFFCSVLCLCWPDGHAEYYQGEVHGELIWPPAGNQGFGYDPIFRPEGHDRTFGQMSAAEKHGSVRGEGEPLSHRARAFEQFVRARLTGEDLP